jgi:hypothetical protein
MTSEELRAYLTQHDIAWYHEAYTDYLAWASTVQTPTPGAYVMYYVCERSGYC